MKSIKKLSLALTLLSALPCAAQSTTATLPQSTLNRIRSMGKSVVERVKSTGKAGIATASGIAGVTALALAAVALSRHLAEKRAQKLEMGEFTRRTAEIGQNIETLKNAQSEFFSKAIASKINDARPYCQNGNNYQALGDLERQYLSVREECRFESDYQAILGKCLNDISSLQETLKDPMYYSDDYFAENVRELKESTARLASQFPRHKDEINTKTADLFSTVEEQIQAITTARNIASDTAQKQLNSLKEAIDLQFQDFTDPNDSRINDLSQQLNAAFMTYGRASRFVELQRDFNNSMKSYAELKFYVWLKSNAFQYASQGNASQGNASQGNASQGNASQGNASQESPSLEDYQTLGLQPSATLDEIKKQFMKLALLKHPDKGGNTKEFQKILAAYTRLNK